MKNFGILPPRRWPVERHRARGTDWPPSSTSRSAAARSPPTTSPVRRSTSSCAGPRPTSARIGGTDTWNLFYQGQLATATGTNVAWRNVGVDLHVRRQRPDDPGRRQRRADQRHGGRRGARRPSTSTARLGRHHPVRRPERQRAGQPCCSRTASRPASCKRSRSATRAVWSAPTPNGRTIDLAEITLANFNGAELPQAHRRRRVRGHRRVRPRRIYGAAGKIVGSSLEGSNTDIADEFTKLIVTQQAYSANTTRDLDHATRWFRTC